MATPPPTSGPGIEDVRTLGQGSGCRIEWLFEEVKESAWRDFSTADHLRSQTISSLVLSVSMLHFGPPARALESILRFEGSPAPGRSITAVYFSRTQTNEFHPFGFHGPSKVTAGSMGYDASRVSFVVQLSTSSSHGQHRDLL